MLRDCRGFLLGLGEVIQRQTAADMKRVEGKHGRVDGDERQFKWERRARLFGSGRGGWTWFNVGVAASALRSTWRVWKW